MHSGEQVSPESIGGSGNERRSPSNRHSPSSPWW